MTLAIIGAGKVGSALARSLRKRHRVIVVPVQRVAKIPPQTTTFLCIPEAAISEHAAALASRALRYVTVSGSMTREQFAALGLRVRTFHPLMGFGPRRPRDFRGVPVGVEGAGMLALAKQIGALPFRIPRDRTRYHAAAVIAGAGVLTTWTVAQKLSGLRPEHLLPIAFAALENRKITGPIVRGDEATIARHRSALSGTPYLAFYDALIAEMRKLT